jgi:hypothetical protein
VNDPKIKFHLKLEGVISGAIMEKNTTLQRELEANISTKALP